ncbi:MAG: GIY-YIG nuclease family protein [Phenylobacterium sp.]|uniref:GIY-YIG nuclease family protein n=1 Tax=Phenylobacterium sp. TaxID=1871053 RepID=UPI00391C87F4
MDRQSRRAAIAAYKERKPAYGVFAVICNATGEAWVGCSRHVDNQQNGLWFGLRLGTSPHASLQAAWKQHGEEAFRFEELERLREDFPEISRMNELKKRQGLWRARLQAAAL